MSSEDGPFSRTQATWALAFRGGENYKAVYSSFVFSWIFFFFIKYRLCIFCYILVSS